MRPGVCYQASIDPIQQYWLRISPDDQREFFILHNHFMQAAKTVSKDRRVIAFRNELEAILKYVERSPERIEERSILTGICFCGPIIAINNRQLKFFSGRCKSSINGSFQQLGYAALKIKNKAKKCVSELLPSLSNSPQIIRQWTVRAATGMSPVCFLSRPKRVTIPKIDERDLYDDMKVSSFNKPPSSAQVQAPLMQPNATRFVSSVSQMPMQQPRNVQQPNFQNQQSIFGNVFMPSEIRSAPQFNLPLAPKLVDEDSNFDEFLPPTCPPLSNETKCELPSSYSVDAFDESVFDHEDYVFPGLFDSPKLTVIHRSQSALIDHNFLKDDILTDIGVY